MNGERQTGLFLLIWGALTASGVTLLERFSSGPFETGLYVSVLSLAVLQLLKGAAMLLLWNRLRPEMAGGLRSKVAELERLDKADQFSQLERIIAFSLITGGLGLSLLGSIGNWSSYYLSLGIGLMIQSAVFFVSNLFTGFRQGLYRHYLVR